MTDPKNSYTAEIDQMMEIYLAQPQHVQEVLEPTIRGLLLTALAMMMSNTKTKLLIFGTNAERLAYLEWRESMARQDTEDQTHLVYKDFESGLVFVTNGKSVTISVMEGYEGRIIDTIPAYDYHNQGYSLSDHSILFHRQIKAYLENRAAQKITSA